VIILDVCFLLPVKNDGAAVIQRTPDIIMFLPHMLDKFILSREAGSHGLARFDRADKTRLAMDSCDMAIEVRSLSKRTYRAPSNGAMEGCDVDICKVFTESVLVLEYSGAEAFWPATCGTTFPRLQQRVFVNREMVPSFLARKKRVIGRAPCPAATSHSMPIRGSQLFGGGSTMCWFGSRRSL
jgi:hypothetical protein